MGNPLLAHMDKNQYKRYKLIDRILRSYPEGLSLEDLRNKLNAAILDRENEIQRRQLQYDLEAMREFYDAPITNKKGARRIKYEDPSYSIVTHEIKENLRGMEEQLEDIQDKSPRLQWLQNQVLMLEDTLFSNPLALEAIDFGDNLEYESSKRVHEFFAYIMNRQVIEVVYYAGFDNPVKHEIHPYFVRQYNNRWFLFGWVKKAADERRPASGILNLPLDRIGEVITVPIAYRDMSAEEIRVFKEDYFEDIVGVTRYDAEPLIHLVLRFDFTTGDENANRAAKRDYFYLKTKPFFPGIHLPSDKSVQENGYAEVSMDIIPNKELEGILLRYADTAKIVSPESFREKMLNRIQAIIDKQN